MDIAKKVEISALYEIYGNSLTSNQQQVIDFCILQDLSLREVSDLLNRTKLFLDKIKKTYSDKTILIVSHSATIRALHFNIVGYDENTNFLSFVPKNAEVYKYEL